MKKSSQDTTLFDKKSDINNNFFADKTKTTNVNILLNRVRLDKKNDVKKKLIFLSFLILAISAFAIFVII